MNLSTMEVVNTDSETAEVMNCLLSMSRGQNELSEMQFWQSCDNAYSQGEQIIWKLDTDGTTLHQVSLDRPVTYVVAQNVVANVKQDADNVVNNVVVIQSMPQKSNNYQISETEIYNEINPIPEKGPNSSKTDSSFSESVDVDIEDVDGEDDVQNASKVLLGLHNDAKKVNKVKPARGRKKKKIGATKRVKLDKKMDVKKPKAVTARVQPPKSTEKKIYEDELTKLENNWEEVAERLSQGCECASDCYEGLNAEKVFRHRLNIADLTKAEHDMYLMGVILASLQNPDETCRKKERLRMRTTYSYHGKKVCLAAFLYLEHVTLYQLKRIRKHLLHHGVSPRIHGNHGRKPSNTLPLNIYQNATNFVQNYIANKSVKAVNTKSETGKTVVSYKLPPDCSKRTFHNEYKRFCQKSMPSSKMLQYSTFTTFLKKQFPNVKFRNRSDKSYERKFDDSHDAGKDSKNRRNKSKSKVKQNNNKYGVVQECQEVESPFVLLEASHVVLERDSYVLHGADDVGAPYIVSELKM